MRNFLEEAMEQEEMEETGEGEEVFPLLGNMGERKRRPGRPLAQKGEPEPRRAAEGEGRSLGDAAVVRGQGGPWGSDGSFFSGGPARSGQEGAGEPSAGEGSWEIPVGGMPVLAGRAGMPPVVGRRAFLTEGMSGGRGPGVTAGELPLLEAVRRAGEGAAFVQSGSRAFAVTLPETTGESPGGLTVEGMDRAVERDARRYDGGFSLY